MDETRLPETNAADSVAGPDDTRREFLRRLGRGAAFAAPVVAAIVLKPSKALAY